MKKVYFIIFSLLFLNVLAKAENERPEVSALVEAYEGTKSEKVWITRIGPKHAHEVILQITGIDHELNGKIIKCAIERKDKEKRFITTIDNQRFVIMTLHDATTGYLYLPQEPDDIKIHYSQSLSAEGDSEAFLTNYLQQMENKNP